MFADETGWQGKPDDDTRAAFADETERKMWIPEDTFEDPDITLKAFRDMLNGEERPSSPDNLEGPLRVSSGKDPPEYGERMFDDPDITLKAIRKGEERISSGNNLPNDGPFGGLASTDERAVRTFLHNSVQLDGVIVDLIIKEGGVTKLAVLKYLTVDDLLRWKTPIVMARYLIEEAVPTMLREIQAHTKETPVTNVLMTKHVPASVVNYPHVPHAHTQAAVNPEHLRSHVEPSNSTVTPDVNSYVSPTLTRGNGAALNQEPSSTRLSPHGPPASSTGLSPVRQVDRLPIFEVCENCTTQDQTVITCRIDPQKLMKLCKPCANMVRTVYSGRNSSSSGSSDGGLMEGLWKLTQIG
jgi:hypothetical protein